MPANSYNGPIFEQRPRLREACVKLDELAQGLGADTRLPAIVELSATLGISIQTISDAVNELKKRNVLRTVNGVGTYVAGPRRRALTGNIGFFTNSDLSIQNIGYWGLLMAGMRAAAAEHRRNLLLIDNCRYFEDWQTISGAILCVQETEGFHGKGWIGGNAAVQRLRGNGGIVDMPHDMPSVGLLERIEGIPSVVSDDYQGMYLLTRHLIESGHRKIAIMADFSIPSAPVRQRREGYLAALEEAGIACEAGWIHGLQRREEWVNRPGWYRSLGALTMRNWLTGGWAELGCTAIVAQNDQCAMGVISALREAEIRVPEDVSVTGFDATDNDFLPHLTTVRVPLFEMGFAAVQKLCKTMDSPANSTDGSREAFPEDSDELISLPVELVTGDSTCEPPDMTEDDAANKVTAGVAS